MSSSRRGGIPGPDRRTGLIRPAMTEAEFERNLTPESTDNDLANPANPDESLPVSPSINTVDGESGTKPASRAGRSTTTRSKSAKPRRIQRMFAIEEDLDRKLWLYAIHMGKDRSEIINDLLRPVVASMVVYDSRDRRASSSASGNNTLAESA